VIFVSIIIEPGAAGKVYQQQTKKIVHSQSFKASRYVRADIPVHYCAHVVRVAMLDETVKGIVEKFQRQVVILL